MDANAISVLEIFGTKHRLEVPLFQRQYVWNEEHQWAPLWEDIARKITDYLQGRKDGPVHFLGAMVLDQKQTPTTHVDKRQVIDGQQRLTTLQIFLAALRDFARAQDCEGIAQEFDVLTKNTGRMADPATEKYKVWPTQRDRDQFKDVMDSGSRTALESLHPVQKLPRKRKPEPRPLMVEAYIFFYDQISEFFLGTSEEEPLKAEIPLEDRLDATYQSLKAALQVVVIDLGQGDDAQVIFETLNGRGQPLLPADLLRNYIFLRAARFGEPQEALYEEHWKPFDEPFWRDSVRQGRLIRPRSDLFLQHYLSSRQFKDIPINHLFVEYKYWIDTSKPFGTVADELEALAKSREKYKKFASTSSNQPLGRFGRFLETFDVGTIYPLLLILAEANLDENEMTEVLEMLESYILRRTVCGLSTKAYNRVFLLNLAANITKDGVSAANLRQRLRDLKGETAEWPSDADFHEAFVNRMGYRTLSQSRIVYILKRINETFYSKKSEALTINSELTVEHIMPQKWHEHWPLEDGTKGMTALERSSGDASTSAYQKSLERERIVQGIGNLTLLTQPLNSAVSNGSWQAKRSEIPKYSVLLMNQKIVARPEWDEKSISEWAEELYKAALEIWKGP